jgi:hypothetical protein
MNRQFHRSLKRYFGEPDMAVPGELAELAARVERKLAEDRSDRVSILGGDEAPNR